MIDLSKSEPHDYDDRLMNIEISIKELNNELNN